MNDVRHRTIQTAGWHLAVATKLPAAISPQGPGVARRRWTNASAGDPDRIRRGGEQSHRDYELEFTVVAYGSDGSHDRRESRPVSRSGLARDLNARGYEAHALCRLGDIRSRQECLDAAAAEDAYRQALALADALEMRPLRAHCHLGLGALFRKSERTEQAGAELSAAIELFRTMDMAFWLTRAEAELAQARASA